jgi:hypothetical protein
MVYLCEPCNAYVGVHKHNNKALGRLADDELRYYKKKAHEAFDKHWHNQYERLKQYKELSKKMGLPIEEAHIGMFDVEQCKKVIELYG